MSEHREDMRELTNLIGSNSRRVFRLSHDWLILARSLRFPRLCFNENVGVV